MIDIAHLLNQSRTIAVVGHSPKPERVSYQIAQYLRQAGYAVYPVNPGHDSIDGKPCYRSLAAVPVAIDLVNVFRRSEFLPGIVEEVIAIKAKAVWAQLGIASGEAKGDRRCSKSSPGHGSLHQGRAFAVTTIRAAKEC